MEEAPQSVLGADDESNEADLYAIDDVDTKECGHDGDGGSGEDPEDMNNRVLEMEEELNRLNSEQNQLENQITSASDKIDENSVYVGQVDYESTADDLRAHFAPCGVINRITILVDKITGQAKG